MERLRKSLIRELLETGFKAVIVAVKKNALDKTFLGRTLDAVTAREIEDAGIDPSGENGEYHTVVTDGPFFSSPIHLDTKKPILRDGYWFLETCAKSG